ncbi:MAG: UDP-glucose/GDP-mannose dehydrogenase family protein [Acidobacteria bacterium]|nr:UDP-glucose/GDP-mannose dehydrogenase family protein [Acidobacteriota bacterium]
MPYRYSIVGLGKLGASMAAAIASRGFFVVGVDVSRGAVERLASGHAPVEETALEETIARNRARLRATLSHREAVLDSDVTFVVVPTPSDARGAFSLECAVGAFREIGSALRDKTAYHLVVMTSTVLPGATRYGLLPVLEAASGKTRGRDFGLCYSPEFIALGSVIHDFLNPDFTLVGEHDAQAGAHLEACYSEILNNGAPCPRMSLENAELAKIALNTFVTTKITYANMLAELCERLPGGDVDAVTGALGLDRRIGAKYLTGALGYGGPCFPRDNLALGFLARALGARAELAETTDRMNRSLVDRLVERFQPLARQGATVAVLGLAYKPHSHVVEESQGLRLAVRLAQAGARVVAWDPLANASARAQVGGQVIVLDELADCLRQADLALFTTPDPAFRTLKASDFRHAKAAITLVDFWRILGPAVRGLPGVCYLPIGHSSADEANAARLESLWQDTALLARAV